MAKDISAVRKLDQLIRAKYPVIAVSSYEEARASAAIQRISQLPGQEKAVVEWSASRGLEVIGDMSPDIDVEDSGDIVAALGRIYKYDGVPALFVFKDAHNFVSAPQGGNGDPVSLRWLRDIAVKFQDKPYTLLLVSPDFQIPPDLNKDVTRYDWPLPVNAEIEKIVDVGINRVDGVKSKRTGKVIKANLVNGDREKVVKALSGLTEIEAANVLSLAAVTTEALDERAIAYILEEKKAIIRKSGVLEYFDTDVSNADIGGVGNLKEYTRKKRAAFSKEAEAYGLPMPRGFLMVGVPGGGKSLIAKASTGGVMPLLRLDVGALMGGLIGQSEGNARAALKVAEAVSPCVLWIDEIEKGFSGMSGGGESDGGTSRRMLGTILTWMQEHVSPVYVVATANDIASLPPELLRRFDDLFFVDLPTKSERAEILAIHLQKRGRKPEGFNLTAVAELTRDYTGAELEKVVVAALTLGFDGGARQINTDDLLQAAGEIVPISRTSADKIKALREWAKGRARLASSPEEATATEGRALEI